MGEDLRYVSPRTGRAVTAEVGAPYRDRLLALPGFLLADRPSEGREVLEGLRLTGHFLNTQVVAVLSIDVPPARERLWSLLEGQAHPV